MPNIYIARRANRKALMLPMGQVSQNPTLLFPLLKRTEKSELDDLVRVELAKQGITKESDVQNIIDKAEKEYEQRVKVAETQREVRRLMALKRDGAKLIQVGHRRWKQAFYPK